jgi:hypothetical protein
MKREQYLISGKRYDLKNYGKAIYKGMRVPSSGGYLWEFESLENNLHARQGYSFFVQYDARGIETNGK